MKQTPEITHDVCNWTSYHTQDWHQTECNGESFQYRALMQFCPFCGRKIKLGQDIRRTCGNSD